MGVEIDALRAETARAKGHAVLCANFLEVWQPVYLEHDGFDLVVMNPPFYGKHYAKHVRHALRFLKPDGKLIARRVTKRSRKRQDFTQIGACHNDHQATAEAQPRFRYRAKTNGPGASNPLNFGKSLA